MKNKIISAMLLGMSATMAVPGTVVMAAEEGADPAAVQEETAAEAPTETPAEPSEGETENTEGETEGSDNGDSQEGTETENETTKEQAIASMIAYGNDEVLKASDTPADFIEKMASLDFPESTFGKYGSAINDFAHSEEIDKSSLYNYEMAVINHIPDAANGESADAIRAMKYHAAVVFENVYGEDAFQPGRDVRRAILAEMGVNEDEEFAFSESVAASDAIYKNAGGISTAPVELLNKEITSELSSYVKGITDIEMQVGDEIPNPEVTFDSNYVESVSVDTTKVNKDVIGVYVISYIITGIDGSTQTVEKQCNVIENGNLVALREEMCAKLDAIDGGRLTEEQFKEEWKQEVDAAKVQINSLTDEKEMQNVVDETAAKIDAIIAKEQLYVAKAGDLKLLDEHYSTLSFATDALKAMAEKVKEETKESIESADSVDKAAEALEAGKDKLSKISEQDASVLDELKIQAKDTMKTAKDAIEDSTSITDKVFEAISARIDACSSAQEIDSVVNSGNAVFADAAKGVAGDISAFVQMFKDLKGISPDGDTTEVIEQVAALGIPNDLESAEDRTGDICAALTQSNEDFMKYLAGRAGQEIKGETKAEMYRAYVEITNGDPLTKDLEKAKEEAVDKVTEMLDAIETPDEEFAEKKESLRDRLVESINAAATVDDVETALNDAKTDIEAFAKEVGSADALNSIKEDAKTEIQATVDSQEDASLRAAIDKLAQAYISKIDKAKSDKEVQEYLDAFKKDAKAVVDSHKSDATLATAKSDALSKLSALESSAKDEYMNSSIKDIISTAKNKVQSATTANECSAIYNQAKKDFNNAYLESMRSAYNTKLDALLKDSKITDETYISKAKEVIEKQKTNVAQAKNEKTMEKCYNLAKESIAALETAQGTASDLAKAKEEAIAKVKGFVTNPSDAASKIIDKYVNAINQATSADKINDLVEECKTTLQNAGIDVNTNGSGSSTSENDLAKAKADAISALTNMVNNSNLSDSQKESAQKVLDDYVQRINAATTVSDVNTLLEAGKKELSKYGADVNKAVPNGSTSTTLGSNSSDAQQKGAEEVSTGKVKTGDNHVAMIAMAGTAVIAAMAAAFVSLRKFLKKD